MIIKLLLKIKVPQSTIFLNRTINCKSAKFSSTIRNSNSNHSTNRNDEAKKENPQSKSNLGNKTNDNNHDMWNFLAFEKNITFFSVNFYILLFAVLALHLYNKSNETNNITQVDEAKERERRNILEMENKRTSLKN
ncbi:hypothetical protein, conserved [Plasmodium gonderi]|uniref:Uncharacterized protein n=1 Tax=Plasmodium gonderi TaxID=77519 RepID=A0A1Y1JAY8_PLAGO|nr:hypothetical protein, conserved [Plasmodium gonderi]GAW79420.1 hypothetical protein, conserved [Plasmodium gonderi]